MGGEAKRREEGKDVRRKEEKREKTELGKQNRNTQSLFVRASCVLRI